MINIDNLKVFNKIYEKHINANSIEKIKTYSNIDFNSFNINLKKGQSCSYFLKDDENFKYYTNIFKSDLELETKNSLINFTFGTEIFYSFASNTQDNIISAEIEYLQNKHF